MERAVFTSKVQVQPQYPLRKSKKTAADVPGLHTVIVSCSAAMAVTVQQIDKFAVSGDECLSPQLDRYIWVRGKDSQWKGRPFHERYGTALNLYKQQSKDGNGFKTLLNGPWDRALVPVFEAQRDAIFDALLTVDTSGGLLNGIEYDSDGNILRLDALESYLLQNTSRKLTNMMQTIATAFGAKKRKLSDLLNPAPDETYEKRIKNAAAISAACMQLSALQAASCISATNALLSEANYNANLILPKLWDAFIRSRKLREGVRQSAILMLKRIKTQTLGRFSDDLTRGFQLAGFNAHEASEAAWQLLALYGNGGPNTGYRIMAIDLPPEAEVLGVSLSFIGTAVTYLDFQQRMAGEHQYAVPAEVLGRCLTPKPYHFWLNAYFSRWLVNQGYSPEVAQSATFIVDKGYQINRDVNNAGGGLEKLLSKSTDHPTNEVIRLDLSLAAAGDVYGSLVGRRQLKPFSLEKGLKQLQSVRGQAELLSQQSILERLASVRVKFIKTWDDLYQPNQALRFFQAQQN